MVAFYNEIDPYAAQWLRNLIAAGHIAPGVVDERSIEDITPDDIRDYRQVHFFAGIGVWSYALRRAGVPDTANVWTGSCPCQPFSAAGKGGGFADERHLWPAFHHLISQCRPAKVLGEQVASKDGLGWIDLVQSDMEGTGYAFGTVDSCSAGFGAPHIRARLYWCASALDHATDARCDDARQYNGGSPLQPARLVEPGVDGELADADPTKWRTDAPGRDERDGTDTGRSQGAGDIEGCGGAGTEQSSPVNGPWRNADWIFCRDGRWRPVEPGSFPLAHGLPRSLGTSSAELRQLASVAGLDAKSLARAKDYRIGSLKGYGNAINAEQAEAFCRAALT